MKKLGIIGGIAPPSTVEYYKLLTKLYNKESQYPEYPNLMINSLDLNRVLPLLINGKTEDLAKLLLKEIEVLKMAGCTLVGIASNAAHLVITQVVKGSTLPIVSIIDAAKNVALSQNMKRLGLIGTKFVMNMKLYRNVFMDANLKIIVPNSSDQDFIHKRYIDELIHGEFNSKTKLEFINLILKFQKENKLDGIILGGTELPILLDMEELDGIPLLDTTRIHVEALLQAL